MNIEIVAAEALLYTILFTAMVLIPTIKNPVSGIHNYPREIQEEYFKTHPRIETALTSKRTILVKSFGVLLFVAILTAGAIIAGAERFADGFCFGAGVLPFFWIGCCSRDLKSSACRERSAWTRPTRRSGFT